MKIFRKSNNYKTKSIELGLDQLAKLNQEEHIRVKNRRDIDISKIENMNWGEVTKEVKDKELKTPTTPKPLVKRGEESERTLAEDNELREQILKGLDDTLQLTKEYQTVTECLNDMQILEGLPETVFHQIKHTAGIIIRLKEDRKIYQQDTKKVNDRIYLKLEEEKEQMPKTIRNLGDEEIFASKLKQEIDVLEGDKGALKFEKMEVEESHRRNMKISLSAIFLFFAVFVLLIALQLFFEVDTQIGIILTGICATVVTLTVFIRYFNNNYSAQTTERDLKRVVDKQNKLKAKYVNVVKAIEYNYKNYDVHSASELLFLWEQFMVAKSARENFQKSGSEIQYYEERLVGILKEYQISNAESWLERLEQLAEEKEWKFVKSELHKKRDGMKLKLEQRYKELHPEEINIGLNNY